MAKRKTYRLWDACYSYTVTGLDVLDETQKHTYLIVGCTEQEAERKADLSFAYSDMNRDLLAKGKAEGGGVCLYGLRKKIKEHSATLPRLKLTLDSDIKRFSIKPKIAEDGTLEYIVAKLAK